jgi:putative transcriptional regulator
MDNVNLTDNFLIAMPTLEDPYFSNALVYICEHNENGALGIIVNRPIDMNLAALFEKIDIKLDADKLADLPVYFGGQPRLRRLGCRPARRRTGPEFLADRAGQGQHPVRPAA